MKILVIIPYLTGGGAERIAAQLASEWAKRHDVKIAVYDDSTRHYDCGEASVIALKCPGSGHIVSKVLYFGLGIVKLALLFRRYKPDRIISFLEVCNYPAIIAAIVTGNLSRLTVSVHTNPARIRVLFRLALPVFYRFPARVVAVSEGVSSKLEKFLVPRHKIEVIVNPAPQKQHNSLRQEICPSFPFILAVGRLTPAKQFDDLLYCFRNIDRPNLRLVIAGDGPERARLQALADRLGIADQVLWPGRVDDVDSLYRTAICSVLCSRWEGWPIVIVEAMVNGCPVVAYDCEYGPAEIIEHGKSGFLVPQGDVTQLTLAVKQVLGDHTLRMLLTDGGKKRSSKFDIAPIAEKWIAR